MTFFTRHASPLKLILVFLLISSLLALSFEVFGVFEHFDKSWVDDEIRNQGQLGILSFFIVIALATSAGLPRQVAAFAAGYAFGTLQGVLIATLAATAGCTMTYSFARFLLAKPLLKRYAEKMNILHKFLAQDTVTKTFILRLLPAGNNFLLNLCAGVLRISPIKFIGASYLGFFPQMSIFALAGSGVQDMSTWQVIFSLILAVIAGLMSLHLYRKYQRAYSTFH